MKIRFGILMLTSFASLGASVAGQDVPAVQYPEFADATLDNGLRILVAEHREQPAAFFRLLTRAGTLDERLGKEGLAAMTAAMLTEGTALRTAEELAARIEGVGGRLGASAHTEYTVVYCDILSEHASTGLDLFAEVILRPAFSQKGLRKVRGESVAAVKQLQTDPGSQAMIEARKLLFGSKHRLGRTTTARSLKRVRVEDVRSFYDERFSPNGSIVVALGDFDRSVMLDKLAAALSEWASKPVPARTPITVEPPCEKRFRFVHKPRLLQGSLAFCIAAPGTRHPDRPAWELLDYVVAGGAFSSRLLTTIRSEAGKTYNVGSIDVPLRGQGYWCVLTSTRNEEVAATLELVLKEIVRAHRDGVTPEELARAKAYFRGSIPISLESPENLLSRILDRIHQGYTLEELSREAAQLEAVSMEEVARVANHWLDVEQLVCVLVGDRRDLRGTLERIGDLEGLD